MAVAIGVLLYVAALAFGSFGAQAQEAAVGDEAPASDSSARVLVGEIDAEINKVAAAFVRRLVEEGEQRGVDAVLIRLNTLGGPADSALAIRDVLLETPLTSLMYIDKRAISAGAMISFACDQIAIAPGGTIGAAAPVLQGGGEGGTPQPVQEKYVSFFREEIRSTAEAQGRDGDLAAAMVDQDEEVEGVSEKGKLLTLTARRAVELGIADLEAATLEEALEGFGFGGATVETLESNWAEDIAGFLTSQAVAGLLLTAMLLLGYLEWQTPGFGFFGGGALVCFLILYFSHYMVNLAGWEELSLFVLGILLLMVELFVLPGFGVAGLAGLVCVMISAVMLMVAGDFGSIDIQNPFTLEALQRVMLSMVLGVAGVLLLIRLMPRDGSGVTGRLVLASALAPGSGDEDEHDGDGHRLSPGDRGVALTALRPAGRALFGSFRTEVETAGDYIDKDTPLEVVRLRGGRAIVRKARSESRATAASSPDSSDRQTTEADRA